MIPKIQSVLRDGLQSVITLIQNDARLLARTLPKQWLGAFVVAIVFVATLPLAMFFVASGTIDAWIGARGLGAATSSVYGLPFAFVVTVAAMWVAQAFIQMFEGKLRSVARRRSLELSVVFASITLIVLGWMALGIFGLMTALVLSARELPLWWQRTIVSLPTITMGVFATERAVRFVVSRAISVGDGVVTLAVLVFLLLTTIRIVTLAIDE